MKSISDNTSSEINYYKTLRDECERCLVNLTTEEGIMASSRTEAYGCIFGRDSAITILKMLNVYKKTKNKQFLDTAKRTLSTLIALQGRVVNIENGEEPGKFIHEFRKDNYAHLVSRPRPWHITPEGQLRNYDSIDATALILIAMYKLFELTKSQDYVTSLLPSIKSALNWLLTYADKDNDFHIEYELSKNRKSGGLVVQSWTDSFASLVQEDGSFPQYPIAPVEVQAISWLALRLWADFFNNKNRPFSTELKKRATCMKRAFNKSYIIVDSYGVFAAQALDGNKNRITTITANPLLCLWASYTNPQGIRECIIDAVHIAPIVRRAFLSDLFDYDAGMRTMSTLSHSYNQTPQSYHNGSFWPMLNGLIHEGLTMWGFKKEADTLGRAMLHPIIHHFKTPIELYIKDKNGNLIEYISAYGKKGCRYQAWSAASILDIALAGTSHESNGSMERSISVIV